MGMEVLNGYLMYLSMLKDSTMVVASMEKGNKPLNKAMLPGMIMATFLIAWRNQYNLTHKTIPKSPQTMFPDDPWTSINEAKTKGLRLWVWESLKDCTEINKLMVFTYEAAER